MGGVQYWSDLDMGYIRSLLESTSWKFPDIEVRLRLGEMINGKDFCCKIDGHKSSFELRSREALPSAVHLSSK